MSWSRLDIPFPQTYPPCLQTGRILISKESNQHPTRTASIVTILYWRYFFQNINKNNKTVNNNDHQDNNSSYTFQLMTMKNVIYNFKTAIKTKLVNNNDHKDNNSSYYFQLMITKKVMYNFKMNTCSLWPDKLKRES